MRLSLYAMTVFFGLLFFMGEAGAAPLESLVMPGPLSKAHAKYEADCSNCHSALDKTRQKSLCVECHKNVGRDIEAKTGFHGRHPQVPAAECKSCHTDHEGREADILGFNRETFRHEMTDFPLQGKHASAACQLCHMPAKKYHEAAGDCFSCHKKDDSHKGDMGKDCASCHVADGWREVKFDHSKTDFPLRGHHAKVDCQSCHTDTRYKQTPKECVACHANNDRHEGRFGQGCADCHTEQDWKKAKFDHGKKTDFALKGEHAGIDCEACHTSLDPGKKVPVKCNDCHLAVDIHRGRNGPGCQDCHTETGWRKTTFDHDKDTKFVLAGAHREVDCFACHRESPPEGKAKKAQVARICIDCHVTDDVHQGNMGRECQNCHGEADWSRKVVFDHDLTAFPLNGLHAIAACDDCHISKEFSKAQVECISCHKEDDAHKKALGEDCATCHNPNGWLFWQFDHTRQTDFALDGAHEKLACAACHTKPAGKKVSQDKDCIACHRSDDIHDGRFGAQCNRCHITETFKEIRIAR